LAHELSRDVSNPSALQQNQAERATVPSEMMEELMPKRAMGLGL
jgi:hypothetical protein